LTVRVPTTNGVFAASSDEVRELFTKDYERTFGHTLGEPVEIVSIRSGVRTPLPRKTAERNGKQTAHHSAGERTVDAYSFTENARMLFKVIERASLASGSHCDGPAILLEETATTYVDSGFRAKVHASGVLFLSDQRS
jgi:N-methylhydantoinase A